jgi:hypothetical protein
VRPIARHRAAGIALTILALLCAVPLPSLAAVGSADHGGYRPHYQGYGVKTAGGRGGTIRRVTNLNDSGPGSLRAALEASGRRIVIFETSGLITLLAPIYVTSPYITVAGQTAPSPGITVRDDALYIDTHDVVLQHLRFQLGDRRYRPEESGTLYVRNNAYNIVLDHLSLAWTMATAIGLNAWEGPQWRDVSILDCLVSYGLRKNHLTTGPGMLFAFSWDGTVTLGRTLFVHNSHRQPWIGAGTRASVFNNVAYGSGNSGGDQSSLYGFAQLIAKGYGAQTATNETGWVIEAVLQNNKFIPSYGTGNPALGTDGTHASTKSIDVDLGDRQAKAGYRLFLEGNIGPSMSLNDQWSGVNFMTAGDRSMIDAGSVPSWHAQFEFDLLSPDEVEEYVLANAGARPLDRDRVDATAAAQAKTRTGSRVTSQWDMGGWPSLRQNIRPLQVPKDPHAVAPGQTFRTNIEMWLEEYARDLEPGRRSDSSLSAPKDTPSAPSPSVKPQRGERGARP